MYEMKPSFPVYEQTSPIPVHCVAQAANQAIKSGWMLHSTVAVGMIPSNSGLIVEGNMQGAIPAVSLIFMCDVREGDAIPTLPNLQLRV